MLCRYFLIKRHTLLLTVSCHAVFRVACSRHDKMHPSCSTNHGRTQVHRSGGSSRLILTLLFGDAVLGASCTHHAMCAPVTERYVCCFMLFSFLLSQFVSGSCFHTPVGAVPVLLYRQHHLLLHLTLGVVLLQLRSILFLQALPIDCFLLFFTSTQCCWPFKPAESKSTCPLCVLLDSRPV